MADETLVLLAGVAGGLIGGLFGLLAAQYTGWAARRTKLMELEFDMHWDMIKKGAELLDAFHYDRWNSLTDKDLANLRLARESMLKVDLILLAGHQKAVSAWKEFDESLEALFEAKLAGAEASAENIPWPLAANLTAAHQNLTKFQLEVRNVLRNG